MTGHAVQPLFATKTGFARRDIALAPLAWALLLFLNAKRQSAHWMWEGCRTLKRPEG